MSDATADMSLQESCMDALRHLSVEIHLLTAKTNRLEQENAKLRDENSRLRKYISKALSTISYCDCCLYVDYECDTETVPMHEGCKAFEELRELGVEVTK